MTRALRINVVITPEGEKHLAKLKKQQPDAPKATLAARATDYGLAHMAGAAEDANPTNLDVSALGSWATPERVQELIRHAPALIDSLAKTLKPEWAQG